MPKLIQIWWIRRECSSVLFSTNNALLKQTWSKKSELSAQDEVWYLDELEYGEFDGDIRTFYFRLEISFRANLVQKSKIVWLRWNFVPRIIQMYWIWC